MASGGLTEKSDGVSCVFDKTRMIIYGGAAADKIWSLCLESMKWSERICTGDVPPPRLFHSAVLFGGNMLVYGGELNTKEPEPRDTPYYELDLESFVWSSVPTSGESPGPRSHHSAVVVGGRMLVLGGKRTRNGVATEQSCRSISEDIASGFYDLFELDIINRAWSRVQKRDALHPMLWGHTAVMFRHFMLVFGGFHVDIEEDQDPQSPPGAVLSDVVHTWNVEEYTWRKCTPVGPSPLPRAMHAACLAMAEMVVIGGMTVEPSSGRPGLVCDVWSWNIADGSWHQVPFCLSKWDCKKLFFGMVDGYLYVCSGLAACYLMDFKNKAGGWQLCKCDAKALIKQPGAPPPAQPAPKKATPPPRVGLDHLEPISPYRDSRMSAGLPSQGLYHPSPKSLTSQPSSPPSPLNKLHQQLADLQGQLYGLADAQTAAILPPAPNSHSSALQAQIQDLKQQLAALVQQQQQQQQQQKDQAPGVDRSSSHPREANSKVIPELGVSLEELQKAHAEQMAALEKQKEELMRTQVVVKDELMKRCGVKHFESLAESEAAYMQSLLARTMYPSPAPAAPAHPVYPIPVALPPHSVSPVALPVTQPTPEPTPAYPTPTYPTPAYPTSNIPTIDEVAATLAPQRSAKPTLSPRDQAHARLMNYRRKKERTNSISARRMNHLHDLQEQLQAIEEGVEKEVAMAEATRGPPPQPLLPSFADIPPPQQRPAVPPSPPPYHTAHRTSPPRPDPRLHFSKPSQPPEWERLRELLGKEYAAIETGDIPIGRLLSPSGSLSSSPQRRRYDR